MPLSRPLRTFSTVVGTASLVALLSLAASPALAADAPWTPLVEVADAYGDADATVVAPDGTITVVTETASGIVAASSADGGLTWESVALETGGDYAFRPAVGVTSSGLLAAAWVEELGNVRSIQVSISTDGGVTWGSPGALPTVDAYVDDPVVGSAGASGFTIVWNEGFAKLSTSSNDDGATWSPAQVVTQNMNSYGRASLATTGEGEIVAVFQEFDGNAGRHSIQSRLSTDGGATWSAKVAVGDDWSGGFSNSVYLYAVTLADDTVATAWSRGTEDGDALFATTSTDGGATWSPQLAVGSPAEFLRYFTVEPIDASSAGLVWLADDMDGTTLNYATVTLGASTFPVTIAESPSYGFDRLPSFSAVGDARVASWWDATETESTAGYYTSVSCDAGETWSAPAILAIGEDVYALDAKTVLSGDTFSAYWGQEASGESGQSLYASTLSNPCGAAVIPAGPTLAATGAPVLPAGMLALGVVALGGFLVLRRRAAA